MSLFHLFLIILSYSTNQKLGLRILSCANWYFKSYLCCEVHSIRANSGTGKMLRCSGVSSHFKDMNLDAAKRLTRNFCTHIFQSYWLLAESKMKICVGWCNYGWICTLKSGKEKNWHKIEKVDERDHQVSRTIYFFHLQKRQKTLTQNELWELLEGNQIEHCWV